MFPLRVREEGWPSVGEASQMLVDGFVGVCRRSAVSERELARAVELLHGVLRTVTPVYGWEGPMMNLLEQPNGVHPTRDLGALADLQDSLAGLSDPLLGVGEDVTVTLNQVTWAFRRLYATVHEWLVESV